MKSKEKKEYPNINFFKMVWYSILKFEKYPEMAALGVKKAIWYFTKLILIFSITFSTMYIIQANNSIQKSGEDKKLSSKVIENILLNGEYNKNQEEIISNINDNVGNSIFIILAISIFVSIYLVTLLDIFTLSIIGIFTCFVVRIKINYKAIFNMSIFAITLAIILKLIYYIIQLFTDFEVKYFTIMYNAIAYISLVAAILMIKSDIIKQQLKLMNTIEKNKKQTYENPEENEPKQEEDNEEKNDQENTNNNDDEEKNNTQGQETNA